MVFSSSNTQTCTNRGSSVLDTQNYTGGSWNNSVLCCKLTDPKTGQVVKEDCKKMYTLPGENTIENNNTRCGYVYLKQKIQIDWSACLSLLYSLSLLLVPWSFFATSTFVFYYLYILYTHKYPCRSGVRWYLGLCVFFAPCIKLSVQLHYDHPSLFFFFQLIFAPATTTPPVTTPTSLATRMLSVTTGFLSSSIATMDPALITWQGYATFRRRPRRLLYSNQVANLAPWRVMFFTWLEGTAPSFCCCSRIYISSRCVLSLLASDRSLLTFCRLVNSRKTFCRQPSQ